jgi:hypothetical protein
VSKQVAGFQADLLGSRREIRLHIPAAVLGPHLSGLPDEGRHEQNNEDSHVDDIARLTVWRTIVCLRGNTSKKYEFKQP